MIYHILSILVFFVFVAALVAAILFTCVLIDAVGIWWSERHGCRCTLRETQLPCTLSARHDGVCIDRVGWRDRPEAGHGHE